jgi:hypothetical protein
LLIATIASAGAAADPFVLSADGVVTVESYDLEETVLAPVELPLAVGNAKSPILWGYQAGLGGSQLQTYTIEPYSLGPSCLPDAAAGGPNGNGRGLAFDPLDGNLWITRLTVVTGDGLIHKVTPPNVTPGICPQVKVIPFGDGLGGTVQDDIGALDVDEASKHIWAAGYAPISTGGVLRAYLYLVNRNNGKIIHSCWTPAAEFFGNDTLTAARLAGLPGSGRYLLTDAGEFEPQDPIRVIDQASCHGGRQATVVATFPKTVGMTGIDLEWPGLLNTDGPFQMLRNHGDQPFATFTLIGPAGPPGLEDISLCGFRGKFGGDGNDMCPY